MIRQQLVSAFKRGQFVERKEVMSDHSAFVREEIVDSYVVRFARRNVLPPHCSHAYDDASSSMPASSTMGTS